MGLSVDGFWLTTRISGKLVDIITAADSISAQFGMSATQVVSDLNNLESTLTQGNSVLNQTLQSVLDAKNFVGNQLTTVRMLANSTRAHFNFFCLPLIFSFSNLSCSLPLSS